MSSTKTPDELVYKATKAVYENKQVLTSTSAVMKSFEPSLMDEASVVPYHPGAEKFYKEVGEWPPKKR